MVLGLLEKKKWKKKKEVVQIGVLAIFRLVTKNTLAAVIDGYEHAHIIMLPSYLFTCNPSMAEFEAFYM